MTSPRYPFVTGTELSDLANEATRDRIEPAPAPDAALQDAGESVVSRARIVSALLPARRASRAPIAPPSPTLIEQAIIAAIEQLDVAFDDTALALTFEETLRPTSTSPPDVEQFEVEIDVDVEIDFDADPTSPLTPRIRDDIGRPHDK